MKPNLLLFLCAFGLSLLGLIPWIYGKSHPVPVLSLISLVLSFGLLRRKARSLRVFRVIIWIFFILTLVGGLIVLFSESTRFSMFDNVITHNSLAATIFYFIVWTVALGALLYYTETDKVRLEYGLPVKKKTPPGDSTPIERM